MPVVLERFANDAATTLSALIVDAVVTSISVTSATLFPPAAQFRVKIDSELLLVTAGAGTTTWTVTRGVEGTTAAAHSNGAAVTHVLTRAAQERWVPEYVWQPQHHGVFGWNYDPALSGGSSVPLAGALFLVRVPVPEIITIGGVAILVGTGGTGATALANCFLGVYNTAGTRLGASADQSAAWATSGFKSAAVTVDGGQSLSVGGPGVYVFAGILVGTQSTTNLSLGRLSNTTTAFLNANLSATTARWASNGSGQTALPTSVTMGSNTTNGNGFWVGLT